MKIILLVVFLVIFSQSLLAATEQYQDVIYLKNGSIIHGMIIEQVPGVSYTIKNAYGDIFVYTAVEIAKITKEPTPELIATKTEGQKEGKASRVGTTSITKTGYNFHTAPAEFQGGFYKLGFSEGYNTGPVYFGIGFDWDGGNGDYVPSMSTLTLDTYFYPMNESSTTLMIPLEIGAVFGNGFMSSLGLGIDTRISKSVSFYATAAYRGANLNITTILNQYYWGYTYTQHIEWTSTIGACLGFSFNY